MVDKLWSTNVASSPELSVGNVVMQASSWTGTKWESESDSDGGTPDIGSVTGWGGFSPDIGSGTGWIFVMPDVGSIGGVSSV